MNYKITFMITGTVLIIGALASFFMKKEDVLIAENNKQEGTTTPYLYEGTGFAYEVEYPKGFFVALETPEFVLAEDTDFNRRLFRGEIQGTEGPVSVNIRVFENKKNLSVESWIEEAVVDPQRLGGVMLGGLREITIDAYTGYEFSADGLYTFDGTVLSNGTHIVVITGSYITSEDSIRDAYKTIIRTFSFK